MKKTGIIVLGLALHTALLAQQPHNLLSFREMPRIRVEVKGDSLLNPWAGGINYASVNSIDLDFDGDEDLVVFDRNSKRVLTFTAEVNGQDFYYKYAPRYINNFPTAHTWMLLKDYNCDGKKDVFYNNSSNGIHVLQNTSTTSLSFVDPVGGHLLTDDNGFMSKLSVPGIGIPGIDDFDQDSDLDIVHFPGSGNEVLLHENQVPCGLNYKIVGYCWGHFQEGGNKRSAQLNACTPGKKSQMHAGSAMLLLDVNSDGLKDLLLTSVNFQNATILYNTGSLDSTHFTSQDTLFPQYDKPVSVHDYPALFYTDVTQDGTSDLLASPFMEQDGYQDFNSLHLYSNMGTETSPVFNYTKNNFLQEGMLDLGTVAIPRLADLDTDGKIDLIVSNYKRYDSTGAVDHFYHFYKNTGTSSEPAFTLIDTNFANIGNYALGPGTIPAFGDLDGDADLDMLVGDQNGQVHYFTNSSFTQPQFTLHTPGVNGIDVGRQAAPFLFDMDGDSDLDLLVGNKAGKVHYFINSSGTAPSFSLVSTEFGAIQTETDDGSSGTTIPYVFRHDSLINIFVGSMKGGVYHFDSISSILQLPQNLTATVGQGSLTSTGFEETPFGTSKANGRNQFLIRASELKALGLSHGKIHSIAFNVTTQSNPNIWNGVSIRCKLTSDTALTGFQTGLTEVRDGYLAGPVGMGRGWNHLDFHRQDFLWDGHSNLIIEMCFGGHSGAFDIPVRMTDVGFNANAYGNYTDSGWNISLGCKQTYKDVSQKRPNIRIELTPAFANTGNFRSSVASTAPALADLNSDGFVDMILGNQGGGLTYMEGKVYDVSITESPQIPVKDKFEVYPNPGKGDFKLLVSEHSQAHLSIYNLTGELIMQKEIVEKNTTINISSRPPGIYVFVVNYGNHLSTQKVVLR